MSGKDAPNGACRKGLRHELKGRRDWMSRGAPQANTVLLCQGKQHLRFGQIRGDRLLTPDVSSRFQSFAIDRSVQWHGCEIDEEFEIQLAEHFVDIVKHLLKSIGLREPGGAL